MNSFYFAKFNIAELDDRRVASLPDSAWRRYHECILLAKSEDNDGLLPDVADMAWRLRITEDTLLNDLAYLARAGLAELTPTHNGEAWAIVNFAEHQGALSSTERSRNHRRGPRVNHDQDEPVTTQEQTRNDDATTLQRNVAQNKRRKEKREEEREEGRGQGAPRPPVLDIPYQPIPEAVQRQKAHRGIAPPTPTLIATSPPAVQLLHRLTSYWPGDDIAPALADRLGDAPDEVALARAVELWRLSGNKMTNWLGIADWYKELRRRPDWEPQDRFKFKNGNGRESTPALSRSEQAAVQYAAKKRALLGDS